LVWPVSAGPRCAPEATGTAPVRDGESIIALVGGATFGAPHEWWSPQRSSCLDQASEESPPSSSVRVVLHSQKFQRIVGLIVIGSTPCSSVLYPVTDGNWKIVTPKPCSTRIDSTSPRISN